MRVLDEDKKREALKTLLGELAYSQNKLEHPKRRSKIYKRLEEIYYNEEEPNFRHFYSDIFAILSIISQDSSMGNLDILAQNIQLIKDGYNPQNYDSNGKKIDIGKEISKLYDHVNLEIARIIYTNKINSKNESEISKNKKILEDTQKEIDSFRKEITQDNEKSKDELIKISTELKNAQKDMQKEYIAILGIFAAIVIAFVGQMTFSTSVLANAYLLGDIFTIIAVVAMIGLAFINVLFSLFYFVGKLVKDDGIISPKAWVTLNVAIGVIIILMVGTHFFIESHLMDVILLKIKNAF